jgi:DNA-binding beta-propeller fold protein YncE
MNWNRTKSAAALLVFGLLLAAGCSAKYSMRSGAPQVRLQWPYAPARAKVTYFQEIQGFQRSGGSGSVLRTIAGSNQKDNDLFVLPVAIATAHDGRIAVADMGRRCVHLYVPGKNNYTRITGNNQEKLSSPVSVIFDEDLRLYVSDSAGKIFVFGNDGSFVASWKTAGNDLLKRPTGVAYSPVKQLLYVVDTLQNKIYALQKDGKFAFAFGQRGDGKAEFNFPTHIYRSSAGDLYVTDSLNFRIQIFDETGNFKTVFGHHGDGSGDFAMPKGVAADKDGIIYVVDSLFDNVQLFNENGEFLLTVGKRGLQFGEFWLPSGISIDDSNKLYVCDTYNRRIQVFQITEQYR